MQHKYILNWQHAIQHFKKLEYHNTLKKRILTFLLSRTYKQKLKERISEFRYSQFPRVNRLCLTCGSYQIEDEIHLLFH